MGCRAGVGRLQMPVNSSVDVLSGSDAEPESSHGPGLPHIDHVNKRKRGSDGGAPPADRTSEQYLRSVLAKECPCQRKNCLQQFIPQTHFQKLMDYHSHWLDLSKVDQDNFVPSLQQQQ